MRRTVHSAFGVATGLLVAVSALSGAGLAVGPVLDRLQHHAPALAGMNVATLADAMAARYPQVESIRYTAAGEIVVAHVVVGRVQEAAFDPATGAEAAPRAPGPVHAWLTDLHRAFASGDAVAGRVAAGLAAFAAVVLAFSGAMLLSIPRVSVATSSVWCTQNRMLLAPSISAASAVSRAFFGSEPSTSTVTMRSAGAEVP
jgi:sulfite reductase (NADPH) flavoprotein alpha-component